MVEVYVESFKFMYFQVKHLYTYTQEEKKDIHN